MALPLFGCFHKSQSDYDQGDDLEIQITHLRPNNSLSVTKFCTEGLKSAFFIRALTERFIDDLKCQRTLLIHDSYAFS